MIKMYLKRQVSISVLAVIVAVIAIVLCSEGIGCLATNMYIKDSVLDEILKYSWNNYLSHIDIYNSYNVFNHLISYSYFYLGLPLLSAPFIIRFSDSKNNSFEKFILSRTGQNKFIIGTLISAIITAYLVTFVVVTLLMILSATAFPFGEFSIGEFIALGFRKWLLAGTLLTGYTAFSLLVVLITRNKFTSIVSSILCMEALEVSMTRSYIVGIPLAKPTAYLGIYFIQGQEINAVMMLLPIVIIVCLFAVCWFLMGRGRAYND